MTDWGALAVRSKGYLTNNLGQAFKDIGSGAKDAGQAMSDAMAGAIGDMAENQGQLMIAAGLWPFNPLVLAGGAALMALAGALKGKGGGSSGVSGGGGMAPSTVSSPAPNIAQTEKGKSVTLQIMGHYMETEQTQRTIMEMIRKESDATDFKYQQIGVS